MISTPFSGNTILILVMTTVIAVIIACGQESTSPEITSSSVDQSPASEAENEIVEVAESVPDLPTAPDFTLPAANKDNLEISLSSFRGEKPVVLVFYRAYW